MSKQNYSTKPKRAKRQPLQILPREPLTRKARAAISLYVRLRFKRHGYLVENAIDYTLKAERMRRADLYAWVSDKGYRWNPRKGWKKSAAPTRRVPQVQPQQVAADEDTISADELRKLIESGAPVQARH